MIPIQRKFSREEIEVGAVKILQLDQSFRANFRKYYRFKNLLR